MRWKIILWSKMALQSRLSMTSPELFPFLFSVFSFFLLLSHGSLTAAENRTMEIGAIVDVNSPAGKQQKTAMEIAVKNFNKNSRNQKLNIHFQNTSSEYPLQAVFAAEDLIRKQKVQVIIGMQTWEEAALVADIGKRAQVPVLSLAAATSASAQPLSHLRRPFLVQMTSNISDQINCAAAIVHSYHWQKVIVVYQENSYSADSGTLALLTEALQSVNAEIEHRLTLPPSSTSDAKDFIHNEVSKLLNLKKQSRVFIVLHLSWSMAAHFFREAKQMGFMDRDSVWIMTESLSSLLDSVDPSVVSSLQGALGIKNYYSKETPSFLKFKQQFSKKFRTEYLEEDHFDPGFYALQAYDGISTIAKALEKLDGTGLNTSQKLLEEISSTIFTGLSGDIRLDNRELSKSSVFRIINVVGKEYTELGFWSAKSGFLDNENAGENFGSKKYYGDSMKKLTSNVNWPGDLKRVPKGWAMPTAENPMIIGVPDGPAYEKFVKVEWDENSTKNDTGFSIAVFKEVVRVLERNYTLHYKFLPCSGTYADLVEHVVNKTYDAAVGDISIIANRSKYVEFAQPFAQSDLSMLVPVKSKAQRAWMFVRPFTKEMWLATSAIMFYTMFVVWFIEHQTNREFQGPRKDQLGTVLGFAFSSLFFAHREKIYSNYTKMVLVVWFFVVFVLTSSYTASLTSMLTVPRLEPNVTDIAWLRRTNAAVGYDGDSFVKSYLSDVVGLHNMKEIRSQDDYPEEFRSGNIAAAFLERHHLKVFLKEHCNRYIATGPTYKFGGLGFVFQKGSPIAKDFSEAILTLSENGTLTRLEREALSSYGNCSSSNSRTETDSLSLESFWGLYLISGATSTACCLIYILRLLLRNFWGQVYFYAINVWNQMAAFMWSFYNGRFASRGRLSVLTRAERLGRWISGRWVLVSPKDALEHFEASQSTEIEIPRTHP